MLELHALRVEFGDERSPFIAVDNIDLTIRAGEVVALVGESGSGKSTIANAIIGLLPPTARVRGRIVLDGTELTQLSEPEFVERRGRDLAFVPQDPGASLDPVASIGSQVTEVFRIAREYRGLSRREREDRAIELLRLVGIDRPDVRLRQYPHELSGGMKQRILIAMAFARRPQLIIADEPTSALDVTVQQQVLDVFDRLAREFGTAVLLVTHDLAVATDHASRIVVVQRGVIREDQPTSRMLDAPQHEYTARLLQEAAPEPAGTSRAISTSFTAHLETGREPAILVEDLGKDFDDHRAVSGVSFAVDRGTTFSLVGESGSGKTTTARMIVRLIDQTAGSIRIHGQDVSDISPRQKRELWRSIQLVYQNPDSALDPRWRIGDIVAEPLNAFAIGTRSDRRSRVRELLELVHLPADVIDRRPRELSGGQRQRVAIARALAPGATTIVLDEALAALDVLTQAQILALLEELQREIGLTYLFISHDLHVVRRISHHVGVMRAGELVEVGTADEVFARPQHEYTRRLLEANPGHRLQAQAVAALR